MWASASLHHSASSALPGIFARVHRALTPGGHFYASFKAGADKFGRFYCTVNEASLAQLVADRSRWQHTEILVQPGSGHDNEPAHWLVLHAQRSRREDDMRPALSERWRT